jgi:capsular polysaccharide biosynthesis protein
MNTAPEQENTIAVWDILLSVAGKWWLILLVALLFGGVMKVYIDATYVDSYESYGSIFLVEKTEDQFGSSEISYTAQIMADYIYRVSTEENFRNAVAFLPDEIRAVYIDSYSDVDPAEVEAYVSRVCSSITWKHLRSATSIENPENTHFLDIVVDSTDPILSYAAANAVLKASLDSLSDFFGVESVNIDVHPRLPDAPASSKSYTMALLAALIGAALVVGVLVLLYLRDDKINTSEDVEKYLGLPVLAMIPETEMADDAENDFVGKKGGVRS